MTSQDDYRLALFEAERATDLFAQKLRAVALVGKDLSPDDDAAIAGASIDSYRRMATSLQQVARQYPGAKELLADALGLVPTMPIRQAMGGG